MAAGLQIWDASGNLILDASYRVLRVMGSISINGNSGSLPADDRLNQGGFVSFQPAICNGDGFDSGGVISPQFSIVGGVLSWSYAAKHNSTYDVFQSGVLFYGAS